jgi:hypothetical protein
LRANFYEPLPAFQPPLARWDERSTTVKSFNDQP